MQALNFAGMQEETLRQYCFSQAPGKLSTSIDGESVTMDLQAGTYSSFNPVGSLIWNELAEKNDFFSILEAILQHFDIDSTTAHQELSAFLELLISKNLIIAIQQ